MMAAVMWLSALFSSASRHPRKWLETLQALARRLDSPRLRAGTGLAEGFRAFCCGSFVLARDRCADAERIIVEQCEGSAWELSWARAFHCWSLYHVGDVRLLSAAASPGWCATTSRARATPPTRRSAAGRRASRSG
jgi:hypothetical protein